MWISHATLVSSIAVLNAFPILSCVLFKLGHSWNTQSFNLELENVLCNMVNARLPTVIPMHAGQLCQGFFRAKDFGFDKDDFAV